MPFGHVRPQQALRACPAPMPRACTPSVPMAEFEKHWFTSFNTLQSVQKMKRSRFSRELLNKQDDLQSAAEPDFVSHLTILRFNVIPVTRYTPLFHSCTNECWELLWYKHSIWPIRQRECLEDLTLLDFFSANSVFNCSSTGPKGQFFKFQHSFMQRTLIFYSHLNATIASVWFFERL